MNAHFQNINIKKQQKYLPPPNKRLHVCPFFSGGRLLFSSKLVFNSSPELMKSAVPCKGFKMTPCSSGALDYFRARRGPFTPGKFTFSTAAQASR